MTDKKLLTREDYEKFIKKLPKGTCPFCEYKKYQIVLEETKNWIWITALSPYWRYHTIIISKRHFIYYWDMTPRESKDLSKIIKKVTSFYRKKKLYYQNKTLIKKYVFFWRLRDDLYDPISKNKSLDHFHIHIAPHKEHSLDSVMEKKAHLWNISTFK